MQFILIIIGLLAWKHIIISLLVLISKKKESKRAPLWFNLILAKK